MTVATAALMTVTPAVVAAVAAAVLMTVTPTVVTAVAAPSGSHAIAPTPATVFIAIGLIVARVVAHHSHAAVNAYTGHLAGAQYRQRNGSEAGCHPSNAQELHFGSTLLSLSVHSINPSGAPAGSATTATCPP